MALPDMPMDVIIESASVLHPMIATSLRAVYAVSSYCYCVPKVSISRRAGVRTSRNSAALGCSALPCAALRDAICRYLSKRSLHHCMQPRGLCSPDVFWPNSCTRPSTRACHLALPMCSLRFSPPWRLNDQGELLSRLRCNDARL